MNDLFKKFFEKSDEEKLKFNPQENGSIPNDSVLPELEKFYKKMEEKYSGSDKSIDISDLHKGYVLTEHIIREFIDDMFLIEEKTLNGSSIFKKNVLKRKSKFSNFIEDILKAQETIFKSKDIYEKKMLDYFIVEEKKKEFLNCIGQHSLILKNGNAKKLLESLYKEEGSPFKKGKMGLIGREMINE